MKAKKYLSKVPYIRNLLTTIRRNSFLVNKIPAPGRTELLLQLQTINIDLVPTIIEVLGKAHANPSFVKVGANDGITGDPCGDLFLQNKEWRGLLIEPVDYCAAKLKEVYSDQSRFTIEQSAIGHRTERKSFFFMAKEAKEHIHELPEWYDQLGSFDRSHIAKHFNIDIDKFIVEKKIDVFPLSIILERKSYTRPVLLHVDVEGFDYEVLKSLNFRKSRPEMILVEHKHLSNTSLFSLIELLRKQGYLIFNANFDLLAFSKSAVDILKSTPYLPSE